MPRIISEKKKAESSDGKQGRTKHQKLKSYIVTQYLLKNTDEDHPASAKDIIDYLADFGILAERRSIYRDIQEINEVMYALENDCKLEYAAEAIAADEYDEDKLILYDPNRKGFYAQRRKYEPIDIRLLAECVHAAKFVSEDTASRLTDILCDMRSENYADQIRHEVDVVGRVRTTNEKVFYSINTINDAMSRELYGQRHEPEQIRFKYMKHTISDKRQQVERRNGAIVTVSPYRLIMNDGNYYLLAYESNAKKFFHYRVDRMKGVDLTGLPREGQESFEKIDIANYTRRVFSMYSGKQYRVKLRFINRLLDTAVEKFGRKGDTEEDYRFFNTAPVYAKLDEGHFTVEATVEVSDQFYGWLLGFGRRVKILEPQPVVEGFKAYLDKIRAMYEDRPPED